MNEAQIEAAAQNPELRKKLRIDRIKRKTMMQNQSSKNGVNSVFDDPDQGDWVKS